MFQNQIAAFKDYVILQKRMSLHTSKAYLQDLAQWTLFMEKEYNLFTIQEIDHKILRAWVVQLSEQKLEPKTINRKIATLKAFFKYLLKNNITKTDPSKALKSLKVPKSIPQFVKNNEMERLFEMANFGKDFVGLRNQVIIELLYGTGIRLAELIGLQNNDIDLHQAQIKVTGKRNKQRIIPINNTLLDLLKNYIQQKNDIFNEPHLILTDSGKIAYPMQIQRICNKILSENTMLKKKSPHVLRHTFATHMLNQGADLNAIKELLGHSSLAATQVYTHNSIKKLKEAHQLAHPKA